MMSSIQAIVREASLVPVHLPNINALKDALSKARDWSSKVDHVQVFITTGFLYIMYVYHLGSLLWQLLCQELVV